MRLKLGKSAETIILMDLFGRFSVSLTLFVMSFTQLHRLKKGLSETNFPHNFSALSWATKLLPSFNLTYKVPGLQNVRGKNSVKVQIFCEGNLFQRLPFLT